VLELKKTSAIEIIRPQQWYKNLLIFLPIIFSQQIFEIEILTNTVFGFIILCMAFGGSYIVNDLIDYKKDLTHPEKVKRPLTSGKITKKQAIGLAFSLLIVAEFLAFLLNPIFFIITTLMILSTLSYSAFLKNIFLVDVFFIAINYVLRAISGFFLLDLSKISSISPWLIMGVFFVALLLSFGKRKSEILYLKDSANNHRKTLSEYTPETLNFCIGITAATVIIAYSIYAITGPPQINDWRLVLTIPVFFFNLILYVIHMLKGGYKGKEFNYLLKTDKKILGGMVILFLMVIVLIYFVPDNYFN
jgi:4-hydroxybenzoate polyprenyltransferase